MTRLNLFKGLGPALQLVEGYTVELDEEVHDVLDQRTNPTWPTTWFAPRLTGKGPFRSVYSVMDAWGSNHCVMTPGHVGADFISLAANLRIPVYMHNLKKINSSDHLPGRDLELQIPNPRIFVRARNWVLFTRATNRQVLKFSGDSKEIKLLAVFFLEIEDRGLEGFWCLTVNRLLALHCGYQYFVCGC